MEEFPEGFLFNNHHESCHRKTSAAAVLTIFLAAMGVPQNQGLSISTSSSRPEIRRPSVGSGVGTQPPQLPSTTTTASTPSVTTRRRATSGLLAPFIAAAQLRGSPATAFDNGVPDMELYKTKTKFPGTRPDILGLQGNGKLAACDDGLNCFSTTGDEAHLLEPWKPPPGDNKGDAMKGLLETVRAYPPGQNRVDKGGFSIIAADADYLYLQFESMKHGFIDDVEFAVTTNNDGGGRVEVQVRSASRMGNLDLGVNAKRLNWISSELRARGWTAPEITREEYPDYFTALVFTFDDYVRSVLSPDNCPIPSQPLECKNPPPPIVF